MRPRRRFDPRIAALLIFGALALPAGELHAEELGTAVYVRNDTDDTLVVAPRLRLQVPVSAETGVSMVYAVDVWTSASIDIVTSASPRPVTEQRDEIDLSVDHEFSDVVVTAAYRYSKEPDYVSHGASGGFSYEFAQNNATLALGLSFSSDDVGRAGDPNFQRDVSTFGTRLGFTQVIDADTVAQAIYDISSVSGYQSSAYRYVAIGAPGRCQGPAPDCVLEVNPGERLRHALALIGRRSLSDAISAGLGYRFYLDDWGVVSHTVNADVGYLAGAKTLLGLRYRFYTQGAADHYSPVYLVPQAHVTTDKELSTLSSHRIGLELEQGFELGGKELTATLSAAPSFYSYSDFPPLTSITAYEFNLALSAVF